MISDFFPMYTLIQSWLDTYYSLCATITFNCADNRLHAVLICFYLCILVPLLPKIMSAHVGLLFVYHVSDRFICNHADTPPYTWALTVVIMFLHYEICHNISPFYIGCYFGLIASAIRNEKWDIICVDLRNMFLKNKVFV